jgi:lipopolysaccharide/colanic/teichoic acid biosynthesis glycosyltransferase
LPAEYRTPPTNATTVGEEAPNKLVVSPNGKPQGAYCRFWKRMIDIGASLLGLLLLAPILALIAVLVKCTSRGPALFWQERVGREGKPFRLAKFRSMVIDAEKKGPGITSSGDCRVTPFGGVLRRSKIDELPQLWNVLVGEMSIVGPRPEMSCYVASYSEDQKRVLQVRPGITDPASIQYRHEERVLAQSEDAEKLYVRAILPHKLELNLEYLEKMSLFFDFKLILQTLRSLLS